MTQPFTDALTWMPKSRSMAATLARAHDLARARGHHAVTLEHLLLALIEDADAASVLAACNIDVAHLGSEVSGYVDRRPAGDHATPDADPALVRILQYAVAAARQSRRGEVNGAIVLAAVVGEGQSEAAKLLQAAGLTFQETVRALQQAASAPRQAPAPNGAQPEQVPQPPEDPLAAARRRVDALRANAGLHTQTRPRPPPEPSVSTPPPDAPPGAFQPEHDPAPDAAPQPDTPPPPAATPQEPAAGAPTFQPPPRSPRPEPRPRQPEEPPAAGDWMPAPIQGHPAPNSRPPRMPPPVPPVAGPPPLPHASGRPSTSQAIPSAQGAFFEPPWENRSAPTVDRAETIGSERDRNRRAEPIAPSVVEPADLDRLAETLPRRMRCGRSQAVEVRLLRPMLATLFSRNEGAFTDTRQGAIVGRTVTVRLKSPMRSSTVELLSPETLWVGASTDTREDDILRWRWLITPQKGGRQELRLTLLMRTFGTDGIAVDQSTPEIKVDVNVKKDWRQLVSRLGGWLLAAFGGAVIVLAANGYFAVFFAATRSLLGLGPG